MKRTPPPLTAILCTNKVFFELDVALQLAIRRFILSSRWIPKGESVIVINIREAAVNVPLLKSLLLSDAGELSSEH